jgi:CRISPR-associated protein Csm5
MTEKLKLKITTITPVTIGSGAELSPYSDYVIDGGEVCFIDKKKMQDKILQKGETCFDKYVQGVAMGMDNNRSVFDLKSFLTGNKIVSDIQEVISYRCPFVGKIDSKLPIKGIIKSPLQEPYFPGSSIKGAFKTVLMYNWLKNSKNADEVIERVINGGNFDFLEKLFEYKEDETTHNTIRKNTIQQVTDSSRISKENIIVVDCFRKMPIRFE